MINETINTLKCRKCGGPHFTIKCGKELKENIDQIKIIDEPKKEENIKSYINKQPYNKQFSKISYRVKLSELPKDMYETEMNELISEWGHIIKIKVINYDQNSVAYIDFGFEDEAKYFVEAIDKTPFELILLSATRVNSFI